ncbi:DNA helicase [Ranunculus cassubicifolius]
MKRYENIEDLITSVYPRFEGVGGTSTSYLTERTILSPRNDDVSKINDATLNRFPGNEKEYLAADKVDEDSENYETEGVHYTTDFLNSLDPSSLPPFKLRLKIGCPIMLLRNIAPRDGLCNGTRLKVLQCGSRVIEAMILTGNKVGDRVFIPRITLIPSTSHLPFKMSRRQFPVRLAFAMTINKSQGQSVKYVGIDMRTPVFSHGQLYVALSRCTSSKRISVILPPDTPNSTTNVVYPEVLL